MSCNFWNPPMPFIGTPPGMPGTNVRCSPVQPFTRLMGTSIAFRFIAALVPRAGLCADDHLGPHQALKSTRVSLLWHWSPIDIDNDANHLLVSLPLMPHLQKDGGGQRRLSEIAFSRVRAPRASKIRFTTRRRLFCTFAGPLLKGAPRIVLSVFPCGRL